MANKDEQESITPYSRRSPGPCTASTERNKEMGGRQTKIKLKFRRDNGKLRSEGVLTCLHVSL